MLPPGSVVWSPKCLRSNGPVCHGCTTWWCGNSCFSSFSCPPFAARWTGAIVAPTTGLYTFTLTAVDRFAGLWVGGDFSGPPLVSATAQPGGPTEEASATVHLTAGQLVRLRVGFFYAGAGRNGVRLQWASSTFSQQTVPSSALFSCPLGAARQTLPAYASNSSAQAGGHHAVLPRNFSLCSASRFAGATRGDSVLQSSTGSVLHGHASGLRGVALYGRWKTVAADAGGTAAPAPTDWLVMCGSARNCSVLADGVNRCITVGSDWNDGNGGLGFGTLGANPTGARISEWAVAEVIVWNGTLSEKARDDDDGRGGDRHSSLPPS